LDARIWRPVLAEPPLCTLRELQDGTYSIVDLEDFHEALDLKDELSERAREAAKKGRK
jgi:hypothetical protein